MPDGPIIISPMAALTTDNIADAIIPIITSVTRQIFREEVPPIVRKIVREETEPRFGVIGQDLQNITLELHRHGKILDEHTQILQEHSRVLQEHTQILQQHSQMLQKHTQELHRLGVLYEDLDDRFRADGELLRENLNVQDQVTSHEGRLQSVESTQKILKAAVTDHSRLLKAT